jgi:hypothetical protein
MLSTDEIESRLAELAEFAKGLAQRLSHAKPTSAIETDTETVTSVRFGGLIKRSTTQTVIRSSGWLIASERLAQTNEPGRKEMTYRDYFLMVDGNLTARERKVEIVNGAESVSHGTLAPVKPENIMNFDHKSESSLSYDDPHSSVLWVRGKRIHDQFGTGFLDRLRRLEASRDST